jgi:hypothetical protein
MPVFCPIKSKIKMLALTKPGLKNFVWFSILSHDHEPEDKIIEGMFNRLKDYKDMSIVQVVQFYDNHNKKRPLIKQYK